MTESGSRTSPPVAVPDLEPLRLIGRGSYGDIWIARSVLGEYRAIKFVRRDAQADSRPSEREFAGLQAFEPISRTHEGLVHILHVGRFAGGFYYTMELADDADGSDASRARPPGSPETPVTVESYVPRTLRGDMRRLGRFPPEQCLNLIGQLARALVHLHGHGLVHRDIKPSNIIFVRGQPKLADIGLVAPSDATLSCVGTEGYLPPEGPGQPSADIFALGKVLYEIATGRDRTEFPELPTLLREDPHRRELEELNEIILTACDPDPRRRYRTAAALNADLEWLRAGRSVRRKRRRDSTWRLVRVGLVIAAIGGILLASGRLLPLGQTPPRRIAPRKLEVQDLQLRRPLPFEFAPDGERIAFATPTGISIWNHSTSITRPLEIHGQDEWLRRPLNGGSLLHRWSPNGRQLALLRARTLSGSVEEPTNVFAVLVVDVDTGEARRVGDELAASDRILDWCWESDGRGLVCVGTRGRLFTLSASGERFPWRDSGLAYGPGTRLDGYSPDGRWLAVSARTSPSAEEDIDLWLVPHRGGPAVRLTDAPGFDGEATWAPGGYSIYYCSDAGVPQGSTRGIWRLEIDPGSGRRRGSPSPAWVRTAQRLTEPRFVAGGGTLAYGIAESVSRVSASDDPELRDATTYARGRGPVPSPDGETIYFVGETPEQQGIFAVDRRGEKVPRRVSSLTPMGGHFPRSFLAVSPDNSWIALPARERGRAGLFLVPTTGGPARMITPIEATTSIAPAWSPDGRWLAYTRGPSLHRVSSDLATREVLATLFAWDGWNVRWSPDGSHIAALAYGGPEYWHPRDETNHVFVVSVADRKIQRLTPDSEDRYKEGLEWHPDGRRLTYFYYGPGKYSAKIKWAYLDRPGTIDLMIDQEGHWDYVGVWAPDGGRFVFSSFADMPEEPSLHIFDARTGTVTHGLRNGGRPEWNRDGTVAVWAASEVTRSYEVLEDFLR